jgi:heme exporter protein B
MRFLRHLLSIARKDIVTELRTRETLGGMFIFAVLVVLIFNFAFELRADNVRAVVPGALWVTFTFAGMLGLGRSFTVEKDQGSLEGLLLAPVDRSAVYLGKTAANVIFMLVVEIIVLPVSAVLFDQPLLQAQLLVVIVLGTVGFASVGTLLSAVSANTRAREVMLPILLLPIAVPVIIAAVKLTAAVLDTGSVAEAGIWGPLLITFDAIFLVVSSLVFEYAVEY